MRDHLYQRHHKLEKAEKLVAALEVVEQALLDADSVWPRPPGMEQPMQGQDQQRQSPSELPKNPELFQSILEDLNRDLTKKEVWQEARRRGAKSDSANPERVVDATLRKLVTDGRIELPSPGKFRAKRKAPAYA